MSTSAGGGSSPQQLQRRLLSTSSSPLQAFRLLTEVAPAKESRPFFSACFASACAEVTAQMDGIVRRCWRQPLRATGYEASAEICSSAKQMLQPAVFLRFSPMSKPQPPVAVADVISIAAAAALPAPMTLRIRQRTRNSMDCFLSCILPGQPEALIGYCDANSVYTRAFKAWKIGCKYAHSGGRGEGLAAKLLAE
jgi:hypothetical protein